ncbi:hypothetical protein BGW36DRAFT_370293 [Talaromyces proteolyticus]|uniref:Uncharacterized protein n=1 Tax=Talaromyces proteolyticus TaxID=1131652 RepID=A0AAD4KZL1_9EURO|nr:uncharacterized protein BGW36DRAFT_370293 [Talaromyces proteolyticus]KAH8703957.1 hypothetical protein BGW36DRAFT_370293 [Talaromyces proteolyticus]
MLKMSTSTLILEIQQKLNRHDIWYLEVIAVHPSLQGRGDREKNNASGFGLYWPEPHLLRVYKKVQYFLL